ncbi:MAG: hypothetical protein ACI841_003172 [Planctomycetota bacterium]|jgi:hypothetical protein
MFHATQDSGMSRLGRTCHWLALTSTLIFSACSSPSLYGGYREKLAAADGNLRSGKHADAAKSLEAFLADTYETRDTYHLQRFFASYLLTLAHEASSFEGSFIMEPRAGGGGSFSMDSGEEGAKRPSKIGHAVAVTFYGAYARDGAQSARSKPTEIEGEALLPEDLLDLGVEDAFSHMNLSLLAVYSRLGFEERIPDIVRGMSDLQDDETCEALLERLSVNAAVRPWIYSGIFDYLKAVDERMAYKFGIRTREAAEQSKGTMGRDVTEDIADWIDFESSLRFISSTNVEFNRDFKGEDPSSGDRLLVFRGVPKDQFDKK